MKINRTCPKCKSERIGFLEYVPDTVGKETEVSWRYLAVSKEKGGKKTKKLVGPLEAYLCGDCGFVEFYLKSPQSVPWDELDGFSWISLPTNTCPYR